MGVAYICSHIMSMADCHCLSCGACLAAGLPFFDSDLYECDIQNLLDEFLGKFDYDR